MKNNNQPTTTNLAKLIADECMAYHKVYKKGFASAELPTAAEYLEAIEPHVTAISCDRELLEILPKLADQIAGTAVGVGVSGYTEMHNYNGSLSPYDDSFKLWLNAEATAARRVAEREVLRGVKRLIERLAPENYEPRDSDLEAIAAAAGEIAEHLYCTTAEIAWKEICSE